MSAGYDKRQIIVDKAHEISYNGVRMSGENYEENKRNQFKNNTDNNRYIP